MNEDYLEHFGVKGMKWGVRNSSRSERKVKVANAKEAHKQSVAKADVAWNREFAKVKKNNPNANYGELVNKALNTPYVKKTQSEAYKARMAIKKAKKAPLSKNPKTKPTAAAQRQVAKIPKEFKPRIMPDGRSIEITGTKTGKKEVWKTY